MLCFPIMNMVCPPFKKILQKNFEVLYSPFLLIFPKYLIFLKIVLINGVTCPTLFYRRIICPNEAVDFCVFIFCLTTECVYLCHYTRCSAEREWGWSSAYPSLVRQHIHWKSSPKRAAFSKHQSQWDTFSYVEQSMVEFNVNLDSTFLKYCL